MRVALFLNGIYLIYFMSSNKETNSGIYIFWKSAATKYKFDCYMAADKGADVCVCAVPIIWPGESKHR